MRKNMLYGLLMVSAGMMACGDDEPANVDEEVISRVTATFTPAMGNAITAVFNDPDGDGGMAPTIDSVTLTAGATYTLTLMFENALETPAEDITAEILEEAEEHQIFFLGDAVGSVLTVAYADKESDYATNSGDDLPVGIKSTVMATTAGTGTLQVVLAHQPDLKTATSDQNTGSVDVSIDFPVTVQ